MNAPIFHFIAPPPPPPLLYVSLQADLEAREAQIQEMGAGAEWKEDVQQELYENTARAQPYQDATKSSGVHNFLEVRIHRSP